jgi:hypothetical protein
MFWLVPLLIIIFVGATYNAFAQSTIGNDTGTSNVTSCSNFFCPAYGNVSNPCPNNSCQLSSSSIGAVWDEKSPLTAFASGNIPLAISEMFPNGWSSIGPQSVINSTGPYSGGQVLGRYVFANCSLATAGNNLLPALNPTGSGYTYTLPKPQTVVYVCATPANFLSDYSSQYGTLLQHCFSSVHLGNICTTSNIYLVNLYWYGVISFATPTNPITATGGQSTPFGLAVPDPTCITKICGNGFGYIWFPKSITITQNQYSVVGDCSNSNLTFSCSVNSVVTGSTSSGSQATSGISFTLLPVFAFLAGILIFLAGSGFSVQGAISFISSGFSGGAGINTQGTKLAQCIGFGLIIWAFARTEFSRWSAIDPFGITTFVYLALNVWFFLGIYEWSQSIV